MLLNAVKNDVVKLPSWCVVVNSVDPVSSGALIFFFALRKKTASGCDLWCQPPSLSLHPAPQIKYFVPYNHDLASVTSSFFITIPPSNEEGVSRFFFAPFFGNK